MKKIVCVIVCFICVLLSSLVYANSNDILTNQDILVPSADASENSCDIGLAKYKLKNLFNLNYND